MSHYLQLPVTKVRILHIDDQTHQAVIWSGEQVIEICEGPCSWDVFAWAMFFLTKTRRPV